MPIAFSKSGVSIWLASLKRRRSAAVSSRTSPFVSISGARLAIVFYLSRVGLAKADDANAASSWGEAQHVQATDQKSHCYETRLRVCFSGVLVDECRFEVKIRCQLKAQAAFKGIAFILGCV